MSSQDSILDYDTLRQICLEQGADDVGFIEFGRKELAEVNKEVAYLYPKTKTIISFCIRSNPENVRSLSRPLANEEFHSTYDEINHTASKIVKELNKQNVRGVSCNSSFPMDMDNWSGKIWEISHKPLAVQAGLGHQGIHRSVIHPKFGSFIQLGAVLIDTAVNKYDKPIDYNPCVTCLLCVAVCPVGALDGKKPFNFNACMTHNYRDFMGGFQDWVVSMTDAKNSAEYRQKRGDNETVSVWQSLSYGPQYKSAYCISVCPAGDEMIPPFKKDRANYLKEYLHPYKNKEEPVYVIEGTKAEKTAKKNLKKQVKLVKPGLRPASIKHFLSSMRIVFDPDRAENLDITAHFEFFGKEQATATAIIKNSNLELKLGKVGNANLEVTCDSEIWIKLVNQEINPASVISDATKIKVKGNLEQLQQFQNCFVGLG